MTRIVTLTMNPALDVSTDTDTVFPGEKLRCGPTVLDPGGGGVNVSRVVHRLGGETVAVCVSGGLVGGLHAKLLDAEGVAQRLVPIAQGTRESFTVGETSTGQQYRFVLAGPTLTEAETASVIEALDAELRTGDWLVASGSLPPGVPDDFYGHIAARYSAKGVRVVVDTAPPWLAPAVAGGVYLVKPSRHELEEYLGRELPDLASQVAGARQLMAQSGVQTVALSLGADGAVVVSADAAWHAIAPTVDVVSTVGAGDSFLGGLVAALGAGMSASDALARAVAAGSATAESPATTLCDQGAVTTVLDSVVTTTLDL
jgi:6-phosphofructokinase 2